MAKKLVERKTVVGARDGALNNGAMRYMAEHLAMMREFGDGRDIDGAAGLCPVRRAPEENSVTIETPESILIAKEEAGEDDEEVPEEPEVKEEKTKIDIGTCVRVNGLLLCDHLTLEAREAREREAVGSPPCARVTNNLRMFERNGAQQIGSRLAATIANDGVSPHGRHSESREGMRPFKERRPGFARHRRRAAARTAIDVIFEQFDAEIAAEVANA